MRLPRRVPWASTTELDELCAWIYADENDINAKLAALQRLSAWKATTTLPHALESTLAILTAIVQDASAQSSSSYLHIRQSYATAIIRLVNGLVDPLQLGAYARSIASIAAQLNLPAWLVELRHAATHEDLPSIEVLREGARDAMGWLLQNYFLPTINPSLPAPSQESTVRSPAPLLKVYKNLLKITTRDASLRTQYRHEITKVLRDIERWIAEAKVAADASAAALDWDVSENEAHAEEDGREQWALEKFCDTLLEKGGLVPMSKKKRAVVNSSFSPPTSMLALWTPLISHVHSLHASLPLVLVHKIIAHLTSSEQYVEEAVINVEADSSSRDLSYDMCIASWANWVVHTYGSDGDEEEDASSMSREDVIVTLATSLSPTRQHVPGDDKAARLLLTTLCADYPDLEEVTSLLTSAPVNPSKWDGNDLGAMEERLDALQSLQVIKPQFTSEKDTLQLSTGPIDIGPELPRGWRLLSVSEGWRPAPIGVYLGP